MFVRKKKNKSGSISVQILQKKNGRNILIKSIGSASEASDIEILVSKARNEINLLSKQGNLFISEQETSIESFISELSNGQVRTIGPELVFGKIYDYIGYNKIDKELFRHLVIARLAFPLSKLKTIEYLYRFQGVLLNIDSVYRFLDKLNNDLKEAVEQISFKHTQKILNDNLSIVFYDMTTLYFEASDEDDLRKTGFSKDGKHSNPQIYIGLLVGLGGYAIGYEIFDGSIYEGHTLIPVIEKMAQKFGLNKPIIVADAGLLSNTNIKALEEQGYEYILGARIKNENKVNIEKILSTDFKHGDYLTINKVSNRLIIHYSKNRAKKDAHNRERGLKRLEKQIKSGKLTKQHINNRGYNKYLIMEGRVAISIDKEKYIRDGKWDGLKGYVTNCNLKPSVIIENYKNLWQIEKAFRMSKTDLRIRPIYHRLRNRIEAHICLSFVAYTIYKELEKVLKQELFPLSVEKAVEITHNMYQVEMVLPESKTVKNILLKMDQLQTQLIHIINKNYPG
jgi:transposase